MSFASFGGILAAIGAASCCVIPFSLAALGVTGAWIGNFTALAPYQPYFLALSALFLALGFLLVYRRRSAACAADASCRRPASDKIAKIALWSGLALVVVAAAFPYAAPVLFEL